jgi:hypothetical protein
MWQGAVFMQMLQTTDHLQLRRKTPRVSLAFDPGFLIPLEGISVLWGDRSQTRIFDLSLTGMVLENSGALKKLLQRSRQGSLFSVELRFEGSQNSVGNAGIQEERLALDLRVVEMGQEYVSAVIDAISSEGRVRLSQTLKDAFVIQNFRPQNSADQMRRLHPDFAHWNWYHGPFDTNLLILRDVGENSEINSMILEYDTLFLRYKSPSVGDAELSLQKSYAMAELGEGYSQMWQKNQSQKVSMGASWSERLEKMMETLHQVAKDSQMAKDFKSTQHFLRALREG